MEIRAGPKGPYLITSKYEEAEHYVKTDGKDNQYLKREHR